MTSEFNARLVREKYVDFNGKSKEQMSLLLADRRYPMFSTQLFEERVQGRGIERYVDTGDLVAYRGSNSDDQEIKIILTANRNGLTKVGKFVLGLINPQSKYLNGALNLNQARDANGDEVRDVYDRISGDGVIKLKRKDFGFLNQNLTHEQRMEHRGLRILARHPEEVPPEFAENFDAFKAYSEGVVAPRYNQAMGFCLAGGESVPTLRAFYVDRLVGGSWSRAFGYSDLGDDNGQLVGVAPEAPSALGITRPTLQEAPYIIYSQSMERFRTKQ